MCFEKFLISTNVNSDANQNLPTNTVPVTQTKNTKTTLRARVVEQLDAVHPRARRIDDQHRASAHAILERGVGLVRAPSPFKLLRSPWSPDTLERSLARWHRVRCDANRAAVR